MLLTESADAARTTAAGDLVWLAEPDRAPLWTAGSSPRARTIESDACLRRGQASPCQGQAAVNASTAT